MTLFIPDMAGRLFLLILLFDTFQYIKAKDLPQPSLTVIPAVIKERDSVQLNCQTPPSVSECYFIMEGQVEFTLPSPCQQTLTGTLLVMWTGQISPAEVKIHCQYSATGSQFRSIYSEPSTVTIQDLPQLTVSSTVIRETESVQLSCESPTSLHVSHCFFYIEGRKNLPDTSCKQTITGTKLLKRADQTFPAVVKVKCYYVVGKSHTSPLSNPVSVTVQDPPPPRLTVSSTVIRERDSIQLSCETSPSVSVSQCYLFTEKRDFKPSCRQTLTGTELLSWSDQRAPAVVNVRCFYYAIGSSSPSSDSDPGSVTVQVPPQLTVSPEVIRDTDTVQLRCHTSQSTSVSQCSFYIEERQHLQQNTSCQQSLTGTKLLEWAGQGPTTKVNMRCFYYAVEMSINSPYSDPVSVTLLDLPQPRLTVSSTVIRERDSVQLSCQTPPSVSVSQCYFYTEGRDPKPSPCTRSLTGAELLSWAGELQKPDISVNDESSHDITIICVLPESVSDGHSCNLYTGDQSQAYKEAWVRRFNKALSKLFCTFSVTKNDLFRHLQLERDVSCDYRVNTGSHSLSPRSDKYIITGQKPNITVSLKENFIITCLIPGSVSKDTTCNLYVGEQSKSLFRAHIRKKKHTDSKCWFCQFSVAESDLIRLLQSVRSKEVSCDYRVSSGPNSLSPRSDGYTFTVDLTPGPRSTLPPSTTVSPTEVSTVTSTLTPDTTVTPTTSLTSPLTPSTAVNPTSGGQSSTESVLAVSTVTSTLTPDITVRPTSLTSPLPPSTVVNPTSDLTVRPTFTTDTPKSPTERGQSSTESVLAISTVTSTLTPDITVRPTSLTSPLAPSTAVNPTSDLTVRPTFTTDTPKSPTERGQSSTESVLAISTVTSTLTPDITVRPTSLTSPLAPSTAVNPTSDLTVRPTFTTDTPKSPTERGQSSTESVVNSNSQKIVLAVQLWQTAVGMASGVGVFLMGLTAVYLCRRTKKTNSQRPTTRQDDHRQCDLVMGAMSSAGMLDLRDAGIYSLITSVPSTFLPSGPVQVSANDDADSENAGIYSLITSVPSTSVPPGPFEENGKSSENDNSDTYHVYSSIPDRPATSAQPDGFYSLLQTH
ncbi:uncharacterized protein LOC115208187 isoform X1 [Salmo trutta]|uniref:uncharacterized protein LOC115208187 isoform X1 n=1 Tax=Salmo trutta TaxID=8032 RepID=UPI001131118F|nr:uncharacterized protein LOC115208187 isoform X1 [Salmo trutta]